MKSTSTVTEELQKPRERFADIRDPDPLSLIGWLHCHHFSAKTKEILRS